MKPYELDNINELIEEYKEEEDDKKLAEILLRTVELLTSKVIVIRACEECPFRASDEEECLISKGVIDKKPIASFCKLKKFDNYQKLIEDVRELHDNLY